MIKFKATHKEALSLICTAANASTPTTFEGWHHYKKGEHRFIYPNFYIFKHSLELEEFEGRTVNIKIWKDLRHQDGINKNSKIDSYSCNLSREKFNYTIYDPVDEFDRLKPQTWRKKYITYQRLLASCGIWEYSDEIN